MKKLILLFGLIFFASFSFSQDTNYKFRLMLKDKGKTSYKIKKPEKFLSKRAIERRKRQGIAIDESDLPISEKYLKQIEKIGGKVIAKSKWLGTVVVHCPDSALVDKYKELPFVSDAVFVWKGGGRVQAAVDTVSFYPAKETLTFGNEYGKALDNIKLNNGQYLHQAGYKGKGMHIAVIDNGFSQFPKIEMLDNLNILGYKGFVYENEELFNNGNQHGLNVLSCIGTNKPMQHIGTAPEASFWLLGSEDARSEFSVEEDYWTAAIEFADSVGVDVANTSLAYNNFDAPAKSYTHEDLDGKTSHIARAATKASEKGMLLTIGAGNSGNSEWVKITTPADADHVISVGAVERDSTVAGFSSRGPTADLRIKPDAMTLGVGSVVVNNKGMVTYSSGTSFASPIMCGMVVCLWQAFPTLTNKEIIRVIRESSSRYGNPDKDYGYGLPDMKKAMEIAQGLVDSKK